MAEPTVLGTAGCEWHYSFLAVKVRNDENEDDNDDHHITGHFRDESSSQSLALVLKPNILIPAIYGVKFFKNHTKMMNQSQQLTVAAASC